MNKNILLFITFLSALTINAQIRIVNSSTNNSVANSPAFIDASSNTTVNLSSNVGKGLLFPRTDLTLFTAFPAITTGIANSFPSRLDGMIVYNTSNGGVPGIGNFTGVLTPGFYYYENKSSTISGGSWKQLGGDSSSWNRFGNSGTNPSSNFIGTVDAQDLSVRTNNTEKMRITSIGNVGVNTSNPIVSMQIAGVTNDGTKAEGVMLPKISGENLHLADISNIYTTLHDGTMIYVTAPSIIGNQINQTSNVNAKGYYFFDAVVNKWVKIAAGSIAGTISSLNCATAVISPATATVGSAYSGTITVPYSGGNGGAYASQTYIYNGITLSLPAGNFANGNGSLLYQLSGTPLSAGATAISFNAGGQTCSGATAVNLSVVSSSASVTLLDCPNRAITGNLTQGTLASGVTTIVPYAGGNGGSYPSQSISSTGVTGLTATLSSGTLNSGSGSLTFTISGTPSSSGTASFNISIGGSSCTFTRTVDPLIGAITALNCGSAVFSSNVAYVGLPYSGTLTVPYTGGNGGSYSGDSFSGNGLTATLSAGTLNNGNGNFVYNITGTPISVGNVSFNLFVAGKGCTTSPISVSLPSATVTVLDCPNRSITGNLTQGTMASGVTTTVPYAGGNGGSYPSQSILSTGVTGLTATLSSGTLNSGPGSLTFTISGTPSSSGTASFNITIGGTSCTFTRTVAAGVGSISSLTCSSAVFSPANATVGTPYTGTLTIPYTGGNGFSYSSDTVSSSGLTATLSAGTFNTGSGNVVYNISGTPTTVGNIPFNFIVAGLQCSGSAAPLLIVNNQIATVNTLGCNASVDNGNLRLNNAASNVSTTIPYTGGNGASYSSQSISSTGVTGLTATLNSGSLTNGSGTVTFNITGTPNNTGAASFSVNVGGKTCTFVRQVYNCGAFISGGVWKEFMCYNLGATTNNDPYTPSASIQGAKYQWGRINPILSQTQDQANSGSIAGWNTTPSTNNAWQDTTKTSNDPCPAGYRIPTNAQWGSLASNNTITAVGTWNNSSTNYNSGISVGNGLFLPTTGYRDSSSGSLDFRGSIGFYWSTTYSSATNSAFYLTAFNSGATTGTGVGNTMAMAVRCIAE